MYFLFENSAPLVINSKMFRLKTIASVALNQRRLFCKSCQMFSGEPLSMPTPDGQTTFSTKIEKLVSEISQLNLIEVSELSTALKQRLNLPDTPMVPHGAILASSKLEAEEEAAPKVVQTSFTVKLMSFDEKQKVALIKECKNLLEGMNLVQAKKFVESAPTVVKADIGKSEAEKLRDALAKVGAEIVIE